MDIDQLSAALFACTRLFSQHHPDRTRDLLKATYSLTTRGDSGWVVTLCVPNSGGDAEVYRFNVAQTGNSDMADFTATMMD